MGESTVHPRFENRLALMGYLETTEDAAANADAIQAVQAGLPERATSCLHQGAGCWRQFVPEKSGAPQGRAAGKVVAG